MSSVAIGIDLGTTYSAVAYMNKHGAFEIISNTKGDRIIPSVILFQDDEEVVGKEAENAIAAYPNQTVQFVKRQMGNPDYFFEYKNQSHSAIQLSSLILKELKNIAEQRLGQSVTQAVITVPAYFGDVERRATIQAGELAGLDVLKIINEPTAAALAYGLDHLGSNQRCLVFDLGGGTFDVTIISIEGNDIRVKSTDGDHQLGGKDWDDRLMQHVAEAFKSKHGIDPMTDIIARHDLRSRCVSAKLSLTMRPEVKIDFRFKGRPLRISITRDEFEALTADLLQRTVELTLSALEASGYGKDEIDTVLLVGGSTRMPMVRKVIKDIFERDPSVEINPDECVAFGAAFKASLEAAEREGKAPPIDARTHDVATHALGLVADQHGRLINVPIIPKNTPIPCELSKPGFKNTTDGQSLIDLWLLQKDNPDPLRCVPLGHFEFFGLTPRSIDESQITITFRYNANGIVEIEAWDSVNNLQLSNRMAADRYTLQDLHSGRIPAHYALLFDCSGSMYGQAMAEGKQCINRLIPELLKKNRSMVLISAPGGLKAGPSHFAGDIIRAVDQLTAIGHSPLHVALSRARKSLKDRSGVFIVVTDGKLDNAELCIREAQNIRRQGGRLIVIGTGNDQNKDNLQQLVSTSRDLYHTAEVPDLNYTLTNLIELGAQ